MAKEEGIEMEGVVTEVLPDRNYRVMLENGQLFYVHAISGEVATDEEQGEAAANGLR